ncbi:MAG: zinc dependent phospholipase C family protein [Candidatus Bathyarchaeota archaeon]
MSRVKLLKTLYFMTLCFTIISLSFVESSYSWSNGGFSKSPLALKYGTHDWIAEHALDWLPNEVKSWIVEYKVYFLYGTELPDNSQAPDGIGDTQLHHIYFSSNGILIDDSAAVRAEATYQQALNYLLSGDYMQAAKYAGAMSHYIADMAVFGHVMGAKTDWGAEKHHSDYEDYVDGKTSSYNSEFNIFLSFDGELRRISAYEAAVELAYDTTFDKSGRDLTCVWMDKNYDWGNPIFKNRAGESLNLAVNYVADVLYTLYVEYQNLQPPKLVTVTFFANGLSLDAKGTILVVDGVGYSYVDMPKSFTWEVGSNHNFSWVDRVNVGLEKRYVWISTSGLSTSRSGKIVAPSTNSSVTATYNVEYLLTINVDPPESGTTIPSPGQHWFNSGSLVSIHASANPDYTFKKWTVNGVELSTNKSATIVVNTSYMVVAHFSKLPPQPPITQHLLTPVVAVCIFIILIIIIRRRKHS